MVLEKFCMSKLFKLQNLEINQVISWRESVYKKLLLSQLFKLRNFKMFEKESVHEKFKFFWSKLFKQWKFEYFSLFHKRNCIAKTFGFSIGAVHAIKLRNISCWFSELKNMQVCFIERISWQNIEFSCYLKLFFKRNRIAKNWSFLLELFNRWNLKISSTFIDRIVWPKTKDFYAR